MLDLRKYPMPRVRHHVSPQLYMPADRQHVAPTWYPPLIDVAPWTEWFGNGRPADVLDLGCGRGTFLLHHALTFPDRNILGIEVRSMLTRYLADVIGGEGIANALWYSVANGLRWIDTASIRYAVYLFPDPWPKKRHVKRRAFTPGFLDEVRRVLQPGAPLYLATDRPDVDDYQREVLNAHGGFTIIDDEPWPFPFKTDQQMFCERKDIPYVTYMARTR
jgi:tRNA (guanine-N7-)-methyltransferase